MSTGIWQVRTIDVVVLPRAKVADGTPSFGPLAQSDEQRPTLLAIHASPSSMSFVPSSFFDYEHPHTLAKNPGPH